MATERFTIQHESMVTSAVGTVTATFADGPKTDQYRKQFIANLQASGWAVAGEGEQLPTLAKAPAKKPAGRKK